MGNQKRNELRPFRVTLIYMIEERTKERIAELHKQLQACGIEVFLFSKDMPAVESHEAEMHKRIESADTVIICYSKNFGRGRGYRHQEIKIALKEQKLRVPGNAYLLPIRLDDCQIPDYLSGPRVLDYFQRDHIDGILRWGLAVRRKQLLEEGQNIEEFKYNPAQQAYETEGIALPEDVPLSTNQAGSDEVWNVPYGRNPHFTGRDDLLNRLHQHLMPMEYGDSAPTRKVGLTHPLALKGLGGIGKTQIVVEYACRARSQGHYMYTLWINATGKEEVIKSFVEIASLLPAFALSTETDYQKLMEAVKRWLEQCKHPWLLIFDNVDNTADFPLIQQCLPQKGNGGILLTTRAHAVGSLVAQSIEVDTMGVLEGAALLLHRARGIPINCASDEEINEASNIVIALDHFPLALDQAGAYIEEEGLSLRDYLQLYQQQHNRNKVLARRGIQATHYPESVATTWSLSLQKVEQANSAAATLLHLCAFLAPDSIPDELLQEGAAYWPPALQQAVGDLSTFHQMIGELLRFSLVKRLVDNHTVSIHRLVQVVQRDAMAPETQRQWAERVVRAVNHVFPEDPHNANTWPQCLRCLDQVQACYEWIKHYTFSFIEVADLLFRTGTYLKRSAFDPLVESLYLRALEIREQRLGADHRDTLNSLGHLAGLYLDQGRYAKAEELFKKMIAIHEKEPGLELAQSLNGLALLYYRREEFGPAERWVKQALAIYRNTSEPEPGDILTTLALIYHAQGKNAEAEALYLRVLEIGE